ncbi:hypothetical protein AVEN_101023-1 [Araneus ventricosus]|uniref:Endonuclease/exonuclease/phosphatase domain-containing protein n=1 Tax=Araneus ventricosus TaxID=182803 RepID=A0A4Y2KAP0_ARAVE|nr:hypothetical protein AVEN_101023-1 [Araneus ventricosus]
MAFRNNSCFLSCGHLNLNHCRRANVQLPQVFIRFNYDIVSVNNLYFWESKVTEFPTGIRKYFHDYKPLAVFLISNPDIEVFPLKILKTLVAIEIKVSVEKFLMISVYCPPSEELGENINEIITLLLRFSQEKILIFGDFDAKSSIWGPRNTDKRGNIVHDLINQFDLVVINDRDSLTLFNGPCGINWIDIMMVKNIGVDRITEWKISDRITLSDHQIMELKGTGTFSTKKIVKISVVNERDFFQVNIIY